MNRLNPALQRSYCQMMHRLALAIIILAALLIAAVLTSCAGGLRPALPFDLGVRYQIEPGLYVVASPADKGGMDVRFEGAGTVGDNLVFTGDAWIYTSPQTGIVYRITQPEGRRPKIEIVGGGKGRLELLPADEAAAPGSAT